MNNHNSHETLNLKLTMIMEFNKRHFSKFIGQKVKKNF